MEQVAPIPRQYTVAEYFAFEETAEGRHEFRDGEILAMAGTDPDHNRIVKNLSRKIDELLAPRGCESFILDQRVRTDQSRYFYPDISIACEPFDYLPNVRPRTLTNPRVIVEVLSPSTEGVDRGEKFIRYMGIDSLVEYVLLASERPRAETFDRDPPGMWRLTGWIEGLAATLRIRTFGIEIPLTEIYAGVVFPSGSPGDGNLKRPKKGR